MSGFSIAFLALAGVLYLSAPRITTSESKQRA